MKFENAQKSFNRRIESKVEEALTRISSCLPEHEAKKLIDEQVSLQHDHHDRKISRKEFEDKYSEIDKKLGVMKFHSIVDLVECMRGVGLSEESVIETAAHENAHMNEANKIRHTKVKAQYELIFSSRKKDKKTFLVTIPRISVTTPAGLTENEWTNLHEDIVNAVGDDLSPRDKDFLERIKKD